MESCGEATLKLVTGPTVVPVTTADAKAHARIDDSTDDSLIDGLILAATRRIQAVCDRTVMLSTWRLTLDRFPCGEEVIRLRRGPLASVATLRYVATDGTLTTLDASMYSVDLTAPGGRIAPAYGEVWPETRDQVAAVLIDYTAGHATALAVPDNVRLAIKITVAWLYERRGDDGGEGIPKAAEWLLDDFGSGTHY